MRDDACNNSTDWPYGKRQSIDTFKNILIMLKNLKCLNYQASSMPWQYVSCDVLSQPSFSSPGLLELKINLKHFCDFVCLVNNNFNILNKPYVNILSIDSIATIDIKVS